MREKKLDKRLVKRRLLSLLLAVLMLIGTIPLSPLKVYGNSDDTVPGIDHRPDQPPKPPAPPKKPSLNVKPIAWIENFNDQNLKKIFEEKSIKIATIS